MDSVALPPPSPPTDLIISALHLPLSAISVTKHKGRKLRFAGQVLAFDPRSCLALLTCPGPTKPFPTILVNISIPLLGLSPALRESLVSQERVPSNGKSSTRKGHGSASLVNRERLRLDRGEWVCVVGWLEGDDPRLLRKVIAPPSYAAPIPLILEAIHISPARPPPDAAVYPVTESSAPKAASRMRRRRSAADEDATPRPRRK